RRPGAARRPDGRRRPSELGDPRPDLVLQALQDREAALASRRDAVEPAHALAHELAETVGSLFDRSADAHLRPEHGHLRARLRLLVAHRARDLARDAQIVEGSPRLLALRAE